MDYDVVNAASESLSRKPAGESIDWMFNLAENAVKPEKNRVKVKIYFDADHDNMGRSEETVDPQFKWKRWVATYVGSRKAGDKEKEMEYVCTQDLSPDGKFTGHVESSISVNGKVMKATDDPAIISVKKLLDEHVQALKSNQGLHPIGTPVPMQQGDAIKHHAEGMDTVHTVGAPAIYINEKLNKKYYGFHDFWLAYDGLVDWSDAHHDKRIEHYDRLQQKKQKGIMERITKPGVGEQAVYEKDKVLFERQKTKLEASIEELEKFVADENKKDVTKRDHDRLHHVELELQKMKEKLEKMGGEFEDKEKPFEELERFVDEAQDDLSSMKDDLGFGDLEKMYQQKEEQYHKEAIDITTDPTAFPAPSEKVKPLVNWFVENDFRANPNPRGWLTRGQYLQLAKMYSMHMRRLLEEAIKEKVKEVKGKYKSTSMTSSEKEAQIAADIGSETQTLKEKFNKDVAAHKDMFALWPDDLKARRDENRKKGGKFTAWEKRYGDEELGWVDHANEEKEKAEKLEDDVVNKMDDTAFNTHVKKMSDVERAKMEAHREINKHRDPKSWKDLRGEHGLRQHVTSLKHAQYEDLKEWFHVEKALLGRWAELLEGAEFGYEIGGEKLESARGLYKQALDAAHHAMISIEGLQQKEHQQDWHEFVNQQTKKYGPHALSYMKKINEKYSVGQAAETMKSLHAASLKDEGWSGADEVDMISEKEQSSLNKDRNAIKSELIPALRKAEAVLNTFEKVPIEGIIRGLYAQSEFVGGMYSKLKGVFLFYLTEKPKRKSEVELGIPRERYAAEDMGFGQGAPVGSVEELKSLRKKVVDKAETVAGLPFKSTTAISSENRELRTLVKKLFIATAKAFPKTNKKMFDPRYLKNISEEEWDALSPDQKKQLSRSTGGAPRIVKKPKLTGLPVEVPYGPIPTQQKTWKQTEQGRYYPTTKEPQEEMHPWGGGRGPEVKLPVHKTAALGYDKVTDEFDYLDENRYALEDRYATSIGEQLADKAEGVEGEKAKETAQHTINRFEMEAERMTSKLNTEIGDCTALISKLDKPLKGENGMIRSEKQAHILHQQAKEEFDDIIKHHKEMYRGGFSPERLKELGEKWNMKDEERVIKRLAMVKTGLLKKALDDFYMRWMFIERDGVPREHEGRSPGNRDPQEYTVLMDYLKKNHGHLFADHPTMEEVKDEEATYVRPKQVKPSKEHHYKVENYIVDNYGKKTKEAAVYEKVAEADDENDAEQTIDELIDEVYGGQSPFGSTGFKKQKHDLEEYDKGKEQDIPISPGSGGGSGGKNRREKKVMPPQPKYVPEMIHDELVQALKNPITEMPGKDPKGGASKGGGALYYGAKKVSEYLAHLKQEMHKAPPGAWVDPHDVVDMVVKMLKDIAREVPKLKCKSKMTQPPGTNFKLNEGEIEIGSYDQGKLLLDKFNALWDGIRKFIQLPNIPKKDLRESDLIATPPENLSKLKKQYFSILPQSYLEIMSQFEEANKKPEDQVTDPAEKKKVEELGYKPLRKKDAPAVEREEPFHGKVAPHTYLPGLEGEGVKVDPNAQSPATKTFTERDKNIAARRATHDRVELEKEYHDMVDKLKDEYAKAQINLNPNYHKDLDKEVEESLPHALNEVALKGTMGDILVKEHQSEINPTKEQVMGQFKTTPDGKLSYGETKPGRKPGEDGDAITKQEFDEVFPLVWKENPGDWARGEMKKIDEKDIHEDDKEKAKVLINRKKKVLGIMEKAFDDIRTKANKKTVGEHIKPQVEEKLRNRLHGIKVKELKEKGNAAIVDKATEAMKKKVQDKLDKLKSEKWNAQVADDYAEGWTADTFEAYKKAFEDELKNLVFWSKKKVAAILEAFKNAGVEVSTVPKNMDSKIPMESRIASMFVGVSEDAALYQ